LSIKPIPLVDVSRLPEAFADGLMRCHGGGSLPVDKPAIAGGLFLEFEANG
jgi:hypothetical protein